MWHSVILCVCMSDTYVGTYSRAGSQVHEYLLLLITVDNVITSPSIASFRSMNLSLSLSNLLVTFFSLHLFSFAN